MFIGLKDRKSRLSSNKRKRELQDCSVLGTLLSTLSRLRALFLAKTNPSFVFYANWYWLVTDYAQLTNTPRGVFTLCMLCTIHTVYYTIFKF